MHIMQSRRDFLASLSAAGAAGVLGAPDARSPTRGRRRRPRSGLPMTPASASRPPRSPRTCCARKGSPISATCPHSSSVDAVARGEIDFDFDAAAWLASHLDAGEPVTVLAGVHSGCYELFAHEPIRTISDLKGKRVGIQTLGSERAPVSRDHGCPRRARPSTRTSTGSPARQAAPWSCSPQGKVDAFLGFPPEPQELRARKIGRVILNTATDQPWSQYFCCIAVRQPGVRPRSSGRDQALSCAPSSRPPTSAPPSRSRAARRLVDARVHARATTTRSRR